MPPSRADSASMSAQLARATTQLPRTAVGVIVAISVCHLLNDMMQSLLPAIYPNIKSALRLDFGQIGDQDRRPFHVVQPVVVGDRFDPERAWE